MATITDYRQQWRRDTAANLTADNPTPENGEPVMESDTQLWKMGDGSTAWNSLPYQSGPGFSGETYNVIDTDPGDVAATVPTTPANGELWTVVNSGSSGNYVTGLPGSISLGDDKTISFKYDTTNGTWRYEDIIIDEYNYTPTNEDTFVTKWAGGRMVMTTTLDKGTATQTWNFGESFISEPQITASVNASGSRFTSITNTTSGGGATADILAWTDAGNANTNKRYATATGRWKA